MVMKSAGIVTAMPILAPLERAEEGVDALESLPAIETTMEELARLLVGTHVSFNPENVGFVSRYGRSDACQRT
jgi:hypothetical protein